MLLTLSAISYADSSGAMSMKLEDLPRLAFEELGLQGMTLQASLLKGWDAAKLDRLRDAGDKAGCPCLVLVEDSPQPLGDSRDATAREAQDRLDRVLQVAHRLGCSSAALGIADPESGDLTENLANRLKLLVASAERLELNLLLAPREGLTETPEQLTALIRKVGGFRIGAYPDFQKAVESGDIDAYLRGLAPYASVICSPTLGSGAKGKADLVTCIRSIRAVGYDASLALESRDDKDPNKALVKARETIESALEVEAT